MICPSVRQIRVIISSRERSAVSARDSERSTSSVRSRRASSSACEGECEACNLPGRVGFCWPVTTGACGTTPFVVTCPYGGVDTDLTLSCPSGFTPDLDTTHCACGKECSSNADCVRYGEICRNGHCCTINVEIAERWTAYRQTISGEIIWDENPGGQYCCSTATWGEYGGGQRVLRCY